MLQFNELRVSQDGKHLVIDVQIQALDYYENVYLDSIYFDTQTSFSSAGPSQKAVQVFKSTDNRKHARIFYDIDLLSDSIFFVYAIAKGTPSEDTPCGFKDNAIMGVAYNKYPIYALAMKGLSSIDNCTPSDELINFILRHKAFELSLETGNYEKAIEYWNKFFTKKKRVAVSNCGCHGVL